jgi:hypothetical protein
MMTPSSRSSSSFSAICSSIVVFAFSLVVLAEQQQQHHQHPQERRHVIRNVYDTPARSEIRQLEERMYKFQTGYNADPDHIVPYENHPYDDDVRRRRRRGLQEDENPKNGNNNKSSSNSTTATTAFAPMRISFYTKALDDIRDETNAAKIDWYKSQVLPKTAAFWSETLSVVPVSGPLRIASGELDSFLYCGDPLFTAVPNDVDLVLYVSGSASPRFCPSRTLAVAVPWYVPDGLSSRILLFWMILFLTRSIKTIATIHSNFDQFDRPTAGAINVCLENIQLGADGVASESVLQDYVDVTIHEMGHVLGHSSNSYRLFWDPTTGQPRTARPFTERAVTCVDGQTKTLALPDEGTMTFGQDTSGRAYAYMVTPKVREIARNQFNCPSLIGAPLENQPTRTDSCTGDHWDERLFYPEALSGVISPTTNILSSLTLALLEDSGWYKANYTNSRMSPWGLGVGCDFVEQPCIVDGKVPDYAKGFFCDTAGSKGCSSEHTHKMACTVLDYTLYESDMLPTDPYVYFADDVAKGGPRQADYCPVYGTTFNNLNAEQLDCRNAANTPTLNVFSEEYGENSKCITSAIGESMCFQTACVKSDRTLRIKVLGDWKICEYDFQEHEVAVGQGLLRTSIICPRLAQACPDLFCPFNCAGGGTCIYDAIVNGTIQPTCECFDPTDTSPACSDSLVPTGTFLENDGGLFDNIEENFFDPLISVFVDHPDAWTSTSWAWAGGLMALFSILMLCICSSACFPKMRRKR